MRDMFLAVAVLMAGLGFGSVAGLRGATPHSSAAMTTTYDLGGEMYRQWDWDSSHTTRSSAEARAAVLRRSGKTTQITYTNLRYHVYWWN